MYRNLLIRTLKTLTPFDFHHTRFYILHYCTYTKDQCVYATQIFHIQTTQIIFSRLPRYTISYKNINIYQGDKFPSTRLFKNHTQRNLFLWFTWTAFYKIFCNLKKQLQNNHLWSKKQIPCRNLLPHSICTCCYYTIEPETHKLNWM